MRKLPNITFSNLKLEEVANILCWCVFEDSGPLPLNELTFMMYPSLKDNTKLLYECKNDNIKLFTMVKRIIEQDYNEYIKEYENLVTKYSQLWLKYQDKYMLAISNYFNIYWPIDCKNITAKIGPLPVCPRYIKERSFYICKTTDEELIEICMHECCHFIFFEKCKNLFKEWKWEDFDNPGLLWYLSEILIDPILNDSKIQSIFKYNFKSYDVFYNVSINNENLMEVMNKFIKENTIDDAILLAYNYLVINEEQLRIQCNDQKNNKKNKKNR